MQDRYRNFAELKAAEEEGVSYRIVVRRRQSSIVVIAPHAGFIEHETGLLATEIAGEDLSLYRFEALLPGTRYPPGRQHPLHITSHHFDEPQCVDMVVGSTLVVAVHGRADRGDKRAIYLGGLDEMLVEAIADALHHSGFAVRTSGHQFPAADPMNICNRSKGNRGGAQLELPNSLRHRLRRDEEIRGVFVASVRRGMGIIP
jgi:phage replication-related protein YjqB (UPF0714/DUF867 family)